MVEQANLDSFVEKVNCPVCGPALSKLWMDDGKPTRYVRCTPCGTVYASPRASFAIRYSWLDKTFGVGANSFQNAASRRPALAQEATIIQRLVKSGSMLDVGCDLGIFFEWFANSGWHRFGVELSPSAATFAAQTYHAQVFTGLIREAGFPAGSFDLVTMIDMLYYVDDPRADLNEVARILKPGGILAVEIPGKAYQLLRSRGLLCWLLERRWTRLHTDSTYLFSFSSTGLWRLLRNCGFNVISSHVIASPTSSNDWHNNLSAVYYNLVSTMSRFTPRLLDWAPKYLILAQRV
jgi:SAM-dependent methyltransferase